MIDFGADPSGGSISQTTTAFREAFLSAGLASGAAVCAPAGTYRINGDITLYSGARTGNGGISFFGAGPGLTVLIAVGAQSQYVFDSCPDFSGVNPNIPFTVPTVCPSAPAYPGTPAPGAAISGVTFANFTIFAEPNGLNPGPSGFYFPKVNGLLIDNVCFRGSPYSIFEFGERLPNSFSGIEIRDSTCQTDFFGHYIALHGGGSGLTVERNSVRGSQNNPTFGSGVLFDTSDVVSQTVSQVSFRYNDFEGVFLGNFLFLPAPTGSTATLIKNAEWIGNIYDHCGFACYYFGAQTYSGSPVPTLSNIRLSDRWAISDYSSVVLDGGSNPVPGTGIGGIKIGGPALYGSDNTRQVYPIGTPQPSGGSTFMLTDPNVTTSMGDGVAIEDHTGAVVASYVFTSPISLQAVAQDLATGLFHTSFSSRGDSAPLANPAYAFIGINPPGTGLSTGAPPTPYTVITTGNIAPLNYTTTCSLPSVLGTGMGPCIMGEIDIGDGVAMRNGAHDFDANSARIQSGKGVSFHVWPVGGDNFHLMNNVLGQDHHATSYIALEIDPDPTGLKNPQNYHIESNDLTGATPIAQPLPTPTFLAAPQGPIMRNNRGALGVLVGPISTGSTTLLTINNAGPFDCTYYFSSWSGGFLTPTITLWGVAPLALPKAYPFSAFLPVGATFQDSTMLIAGSVTFSRSVNPRRNLPCRPP